MPVCKLCDEKFKVISSTHLSAQHNTTLNAYQKKYGASGTGFAQSFNEISKNDPHLQKRRVHSKQEG